MHTQLLTSILQAPSSTPIKDDFRDRIGESSFTREENPLSHLCVYFAAYDPDLKRVFIGRHIKSGLWLFNGGHIDKGESMEQTLYREMREEWGLIKKIDATTPALLTITNIKKQTKQVCKIHFDIWYFIPFTKNEFKPDIKCLSSEFFEWGWKTIDEAKALVTDPATREGIEKISSRFLVY